MSFECLDCKAIDGGYCADCATPNDDLRALVDEMDVNHERMLKKLDSESVDTPEFTNGFRVATKTWKERLEAVLQE